MKKGFTYYSIDTDRYQDRRIKRLKKEFGCEGIAVYDCLLCEIYRVEGCFIQWDDDIVFDIADYFDIAEDRVKTIISRCAEVGLFDAEFFARGIITSESIQYRYIDMCRRTNRTAKIPAEYNLIAEKESSDKAGEKSEELGKMSDNVPDMSDKVGEKSDSLYSNKRKENIIKNNSLSLSPSREVESGEDVGGVSAAEKETFFEILFFRNFKNPQKEVERFINHYSAAGWRRHGDIRAVRDKTALARNWKPENEQTGIGRFQPDILTRLQATYAEIKAESPEDASAIIHGTHSFDELQDDFRIRCNSKAIMEICERHKAIINNTLTNGKRLMYGVLKQA